MAGNETFEDASHLDTREENDIARRIYMSHGESETDEQKWRPPDRYTNQFAASASSHQPESWCFASVPFGGKVNITAPNLNAVSPI